MRLLLQVIIKELLQLRQDRKMIPVMIIGPIAQLLALGYAANMDVNRIPTVLLDEDRTPESRRMADRFFGSGYFALAGSVDAPAEIDPWLVTGRAQIALVLSPDFGADWAAGRAARLQVLADGTDSSSAVVGLAHASRIVAQAAAERAAPRAGPSGAIELVPRMAYNPDLKSRWFFLPGILAMVLMLVTMILPSMAVVREKEIGTLEQLIVTPIHPWQLILGKLLPYVAIGLVDLCLVTALVVFWFGVPLQGSFPLLVVLTSFFLLSTLGLGLLVSTMVSTQQQAMMASAFMLMVPMIYLSGLIFPIENMPTIIQYGTYGIPLRYYNTIIRGIFMKGSGLSALWPEAVTLLGIGTFLLVVASLRFRKSLD